MLKKTIEELIEMVQTAEGATLYEAVTELGNRGAAAKPAEYPLIRLIQYHDDQVARGRAILALGLIEPHWTRIIEDLTAVGDEWYEISQLDAAGALSFARAVAAELDADPVGPSYWRYSERIERAIRCHPSIIPDLVADLAVSARKNRNASRSIISCALSRVGRDRPEVVEHVRPLLRQRSARVREVASRVLKRIAEPA